MSTTKKSSDSGKAFRERVTGKKERSGDYGEQRFVRAELSQEEKASLRSWRASGTFDLFDGVQTMLEEGYRLSLKFDAYNECMACFVSHTDPEHENFGLILVGRGKFGESAMVEALYKHLHLCDTHWPDPDVKSGYDTWDE